MSAPTVTRPTTSVSDASASGASATASVNYAQYVQWAIFAALGLAVVALGYVGYVSLTEGGRQEKMRGQWDEFYNALKDLKSDDERIEALEKLADNAKIKGTAVHAVTLSSLARMNFEIAENPRKQPESRRDAVERAITLYQMLATSEPFKSNPSFGPQAIQNLALCYEHQQINDPGTQFYDKAIKTLQEALYVDGTKDSAPVKAMKAHYLFDKMTAQLGRVHWLRAQRKVELDPAKSADAGKADRELALSYIKNALESGRTSVEKDRYGPEFNGSWRDEAAYLKSLLDPPGKMMADGKAPPMKVEPRKEEPAKEGDPKKNDATGKDAPNAKPADPTKPADVKAPETKKPDDAKKDVEKKDEKKTGSLPRNSDAVETTAGDLGGPSQHMSYAQLQAMLKQGRSAMCQCPRCANTDKAIGAKLAE